MTKHRVSSFQLLRFIRGLGYLFTPLDIVFTLVFTTASVVTFAVLVSGASPSSTVEIETQNGIFVYTLDEDRDMSFEGPVGTTRVYIKDRQVGVKESPGKLKICIKSSPISQSNQWLACLPNRIFIRIVGEEQSNVDAVSF